MEIRIGVQNCTREITLESEQTPEEVEKATSVALEQGSLLRLEDSKGAVVLVPGASIGYVEIGSARRGGVGFGRL